MVKCSFLKKIQSNLGNKPTSTKEISLYYILKQQGISLLILVMFSRISHRMDARKQVISGEETAIELASVFSMRKAENAELPNSIESRDETPERGLEQVGRNDPSEKVSE